jgi:tetratricopeptide (TPR) repeat protein
MIGCDSTGGFLPEKYVRLLPLLIIAAGVLGYANSFANPFIFDDSVVITQNPDISRIWPITMSSRFLVDLSFKLNYAIAGLNVADYHAVNLLVHILAALFLYGIVGRTLKLPALQPVYGRSGPWLAAVCAAAWVAHPLQTQSVTYICQRYASMMGLLLFAALYCFVRGLSADGRQRMWFNLSIAACVVGMGTKEIMVTAPLVIFLYDHTFGEESFREILKRRWKIYAALVLTWLVLGIFQLSFVTESIAAGKTGSRIASSPISYLFTQFGVITHYLRLAIFPAGLCLDYMWPPAEGVAEILPYGALIVSLCLLSAWGLLRRKPWGFLGAMFFIVLAPTSSIMPIADRAFEHRMYVPLAPVLVFLVLLGHWVVEGVLTRCSAQARTRVVVEMGLVGLVLGSLVVLTANRNLDYRSEEAMWRDVVEKRPGNARAYLGLSAGLLKQERYAESEQYAKKLLSLLPDFSKVRADQMPDTPVTNQERRMHYKAWLYASAHNNIGASLFNRGGIAQALGHYQEAVRIMPDHVDANANLARTYMAVGKRDESAEQWRKLIKFKPSDAQAHSSLALLYFDQGAYQEAVSHFRRALEGAPDDLIAQLGLSWLLSTCGERDVRDGSKALELAQLVCRATDERSPAAFDALGAAYAEVGDFRKAIECVERSLSLLGTVSSPHSVTNVVAHPRGGNPIDGGLRAEDLEARLELYKAGTAYRMPLRGREKGERGD